MRALRPLPMLMLVPALWAPAGAAMAQQESEPFTQNPVVVSMSRGGLTEAYDPENTNLNLSTVERYHLRWAWNFTEQDALWFRMSRGAYSFQDPDFPDTVHQRTETGLVTGYLWQNPLLGGRLDMGVGYGARYTQVDNTKTVPGTDAAFLFTDGELFHGPEMLTNYRHGLLGPVGFALDVEWMPYLFSTFADSRITLPYMTAVWVAPRFTVWDDHIALGYFYERIVGTSTFDRESSGFLASLSLTGL